MNVRLFVRAFLSGSFQSVHSPWLSAACVAAGEKVSRESQITRSNI
jgi:hypothetical protein